MQALKDLSEGSLCPGCLDRGGFCSGQKRVVIERLLFCKALLLCVDLCAAHDLDHSNCMQSLWKD